MRSLSIFLLISILFFTASSVGRAETSSVGNVAPMQGPGAIAAALQVCQSNNPIEIDSWVNAEPSSIQREGGALMKRLPAGTSIDVLVDEDFKLLRSYRGLVRWRTASSDKIANKPELLASSAIHVHQAQARENDPLIKPGNGWEGKTLLSFELPSRFASVGQEITITLVACGTQGAMSGPEFAVTFNAPTSARWFCIVLSLVAVILSYFAAAIALPRIAQINGSTPEKCITLNPVVLTAGWDGRGSPAKLQMLFFSMIVIGLLTYILSRAGFLSNLSQTVLLLLGISSVGAIASRAADIGQNRLDYENWAWLVRKGWLTTEGLAGKRRPSWRDLLTVQGEFDVSRFQVLVFSAVVGVALLQIGLTDLATFSVPNELLGLLGLSQVTYVLGKAVGVSDVKELDNVIRNLRDLENAFVVKAGTTDDPAPGPSGVAAPPPANLESAARRAKAEYDAYVLKEEDVRIMFEASLGVKLDKMGPRFI